MRAENWTICPRCKKRTEAAAAAKLREAQDAYGKVTAEEYEEILGDARAPVRYGETMREDYWLGTDEDGDFEMCYQCSCKACGLWWEFKRAKRVPL